jgi:hypothetical protein
MRAHTCLRVHSKEKQPNNNPEDILIPRNGKTRNVQMSPERVFTRIFVTNVWQWQRILDTTNDRWKTLTLNVMGFVIDLNEFSIPELLHH